MAHDDNPTKGCPVCGGKLRTVDSRPSGLVDVLVRRRLKCEECAAKFTTHEIIVGDFATVSAISNVVAAHDKAVATLADMLAAYDPEDIAFARKSLAGLRRIL